MTKRLLAAALAAILLLTGCTVNTPSTGDDTPVSGAASPEGTLCVYASQDYQDSLDRVFKSIELEYPALSFSWTDRRADADVLITDRLSKEEGAQFQDLSAVAGALELISTLRVQANGKVIALPLFMHLDSFWYSDGAKTAASLAELSQSGQTPILASDRTDTLFWSVVAPQYLNSGGSASDLASGAFLSKPLLAGLNRLETMYKQGLLTLAENPGEQFSSGNTVYWAANTFEIAETRNAMYKQTIHFAPSLATTESEETNLLLRADVVAVRNAVDPELATTFLKALYQQDRLLTLVNYAKIPVATAISYGVYSILEDFSPIYEELASPAVTLTTLVCQWDADTHATVVETVSAMMHGTLTATQACEKLTA